VGGRVVLVHVAVHREPVALLTSRRENLAELERRVVALVRVKPNANDPVSEWGSLFERQESRFDRVVAQEAHDQSGADAVSLGGYLLRPAQALDDRLEGDPATGVGLGIEEHLNVHESLRRRPLEVGQSQIVEVRLGQEHGHAFVVLGEERGEIVEVVGCAHLVRRGIGQLEAVAGRQLELQLRFERALDVQVELGLGDRPDERVDVHDVASTWLRLSREPSSPPLSARRSSTRIPT